MQSINALTKIALTNALALDLVIHYQHIKIKEAKSIFYMQLKPLYQKIYKVCYFGFWLC